MNKEGVDFVLMIEELYEFMAPIFVQLYGTYYQTSRTNSHEPDFIRSNLLAKNVIEIRLGKTE